MNGLPDEARLPRLLLHRHGPLAPFLPYIIALFCLMNSLLLAGLAAGYDFLNTWKQDVTQALTVQINPDPQTDAPIDNLVNFLSAMEGIATVTVVPEATVAAMMAPWLGEAASSSLYTLPRLIEITLSADSTQSRATIQEALQTIYPDLVVDDNQSWLEDVLALAHSLQRFGWVLVALILATTLLTVMGMTRILLALNRDIIDILQFCGAADDFIVNQFVGVLLRNVIGGMAMGMAAAMIITAAATADMQNLWTLPTAALPWWLLALVLLVLVVVTLILAVAASRHAARTVLRGA